MMIKFFHVMFLLCFVVADVADFDRQLLAKGILRIKEKEIQPGYNVVDCRLYDMRGILLYHFLPGKQFCDFFQDGTVAAFNDGKLLVYDSGGKIKWQKKMIVHHDLLVASDQTLWVLGHKKREHFGRSIKFDQLYHFSKEGVLLGTWDSYDLVKDNARGLIRLMPKHISRYLFLEKFRSRNFGNWDFNTYFHMNSIYELREENANSNWRHGMIMLASPVFSLLVLIRPQKYQVSELIYVRSFYPGFGIHTPQILPNGNILLFFNGNEASNGEYYSSVVELDPYFQIPLFEYTGDRRFPMFSNYFGSVQRLPNGNLLISEVSKGGMAFEVNGHLETVWRWYNPQRDPYSGQAKNFYRIKRISAEDVPWLNSLIN